MYGPGVFLFGFLIPIAVIALVAYGVWELARSRTPDAAPAGAFVGPPASGSARSILDDRFARGELDAEEYVQRRALLDGTVPSPPLGTTANVATVADVDEPGVPIVVPDPDSGLPTDGEPGAPSSPS